VRVFVATKNAGKLRELGAIFAGSGWELVEYPGYAEPEEGESSYGDNAALKARTLRAQLQAAGINGAVLGDDSGIEVAALGGRPGVLSARYGGAGASWGERRGALLREVEQSGSVDRTARFVCVLSFIDDAGREFSSRGEVAGRLPLLERGTAGFSFDPIFEYPPAGKTFAELSQEEKNAVSHRAQAVRALLDAVRASGSVGAQDKSG
jgi:XTP/dITP diphosphohydrolase